MTQHRAENGLGTLHLATENQRVIAEWNQALKQLSIAVFGLSLGGGYQEPELNSPAEAALSKARAARTNGGEGRAVLASDIVFRPGGGEEVWHKPSRDQCCNWGSSDPTEAEITARKPYIERAVKAYSNPFTAEHDVSFVLSLPTGEVRVVELTVRTVFNKTLNEESIRKNFNPDIDSSFDFLGEADQSMVSCFVCQRGSMLYYPISLQEARLIVIGKCLLPRYFTQLISSTEDTPVIRQGEDEKFTDYFVVKLLFSEIEEAARRKSVMQETIALVRSREFVKKKVHRANLPEATKQKIVGFLEQSDEVLKRRAKHLTEQVKARLNDIYESGGAIIVPFSAGRDSTLLATLVCQIFQGRKIIFLTALTGFGNNVNRVCKQVSFIKELTGMNVEHIFLDLSPLMKGIVIDKAKEAHQELGHPAACIDCKMIMEMAIYHFAQQGILLKEEQLVHIMWGYVKSQADQDWPEQTAVFANSMTQYLEHQYPSDMIRVERPIADILQYPFDTLLVLAQLGVPLEFHKNEATCELGGLNPATLNVDQLPDYMDTRLRKIQEILGNIADSTLSVPEPLCSLHNQAQVLAADPDYLNGAYRP